MVFSDVPNNLSLLLQLLFFCNRHTNVFQKLCQSPSYWLTNSSYVFENSRDMVFVHRTGMSRTIRDRELNMDGHRCIAASMSMMDSLQSQLLTQSFVLIYSAVLRLTTEMESARYSWSLWLFYVQSLLGKVQGSMNMYPDPPPPNYFLENALGTLGQ